MRDRLFDGSELLAGYLRFRLGAPRSPGPMFVIGTGRSGTNWVGEILGRHPDISASVERRRFFRLSRAMALDFSLRDKHLQTLVNRYRYEIARVAPRRLADKSHPNIWIAEQLAAHFAGAVFVGVRRDVYGTVASMLKHQQVSRWAEDWRRYPLPNPFLGIGQDEGDWYAGLSAAARAAARWISHERRFDELRPVLGERLIEVRYEELHRVPADVLRTVEGAARLDSPIPLPEVRRESLDRWRHELTAQQINEIDAVLERKKGGSTTAHSG